MVDESTKIIILYYTGASDNPVLAHTALLRCLSVAKDSMLRAFRGAAHGHFLRFGPLDSTSSSQKNCPRTELEKTEL